MRMCSKPPYRNVGTSSEELAINFRQVTGKQERRDDYMLENASTKAKLGEPIYPH